MKQAVLALAMIALSACSAEKDCDQFSLPEDVRAYLDRVVLCAQGDQAPPQFQKLIEKADCEKIRQDHAPLREKYVSDASVQEFLDGKCRYLVGVLTEPRNPAKTLP